MIAASSQKQQPFPNSIQYHGYQQEYAPEDTIKNREEKTESHHIFLSFVI